MIVLEKILIRIQIRGIREIDSCLKARLVQTFLTLTSWASKVERFFFLRLKSEESDFGFQIHGSANQGSAKKNTSFNFDIIVIVTIIIVTDYNLTVQTPKKRTIRKLNNLACAYAHILYLFSKKPLTDGKGDGMSSKNMWYSI